MIVKASGGSPLVQPQLYRTLSLSSIVQAEQQDRFLVTGELDQLATFFSSGSRRLEIVDLLTKNADFLVSKAADKIFVAGSAISYLERPQAAFLNAQEDSSTVISRSVSESSSSNLLSGISSTLFEAGDPLPPGFKPINVVRYGLVRMRKSLRDLDWFLRYLTYSIIAGDPNILSVNIRGLRELIDNSCSSAAAIVALREMRKLAISLFSADIEAQQLVKQYFNVIIVEFEAAGLGNKLCKTFYSNIQGLSLPQVYSQSSFGNQKFVMKSSLSSNEKQMVIRACYRQVFERDVSKAYSLQFNDLESRLKLGSLSIKEFIRYLGKSYVYRQQFNEPFVNSRVLELSFKHFLGRGISSINEFQSYFSILSKQGLNSLVDALLNSKEYADYFGEETVPYLRVLGEEAQQSRNWGPQLRLFNYSTVFRKVPEFITLFADYQSRLPNQHPYGLSNDPLSIQFGAIFINNFVSLRIKSALFTRDTRRVLVRYGPGIYNQLGNPASRNIKLNTMSPIVFSTKSSSQTINQITKAIYLRIFGRFVYQEELLSIIKYEKQFKDKKISVRQFISYLTKSSLFMSLYWNPFYVCKAIEYLHIKLIGRPTYSRQEIDQYFNVFYKKGYYSMVDTLLYSLEYTECFGNFVVPYERYITPRAAKSRGLAQENYNLNNSSFIPSSNLYNLLQFSEKYGINSINIRIKQGVSDRRYQLKVFKLGGFKSKLGSNRLQVLRAAYRQLFERDLNTLSVGDELYNLERIFLAGDLNVQQLVERLGYSSLYRKEFYTPYPNTRVIEFGTKHFLGRAPNNQAEIRYYNQILASQGLSSFIYTLTNSIEYTTIFGNDTVPYRRFPTLPAANFPNTEKLYNILTKQSNQIVIPSFNSIASY